MVRKQKVDFARSILAKLNEIRSQVVQQQCEISRLEQMIEIQKAKVNYLGAHS